MISRRKYLNAVELDLDKLQYNINKKEKNEKRILGGGRLYLEDFDYELPEPLIAQVPLAQRKPPAYLFCIKMTAATSTGSLRT